MTEIKLGHIPKFVIRHSHLSWLFSGIHFGMDDFGVRWQSGSGDGASGRA
jgi:hypothetical protein